MRWWHPQCESNESATWWQAAKNETNSVSRPTSIPHLPPWSPWLSRLTQRRPSHCGRTQISSRRKETGRSHCFLKSCEDFCAEKTQLERNMKKTVRLPCSYQSFTVNSMQQSTSGWFQSNGVEQTAKETSKRWRKQLDNLSRRLASQHTWKYINMQWRR